MNLFRNARGVKIPVNTPSVVRFEKDTGAWLVYLTQHEDGSPLLYEYNMQARPYSGVNVLDEECHDCCPHWDADDIVAAAPILIPSI